MLFVLNVIKDTTEMFVELQSVFHNHPNCPNCGQKNLNNKSRESIPVIESVLKEVVELRSESEFQKIYKCAEDLLEKTNCGYEPRPERQKARPARLQSSFILTDSFGERCSEESVGRPYHPVIDIFCSELKRRFDENRDILLAICDADKFCFQKLKPLEKLAIPSVEELCVAKNYSFRTDSDKSNSKPNRVNGANQKMYGLFFFCTQKNCFFFY